MIAISMLVWMLFVSRDCQPVFTACSKLGCGLGGYGPLGLNGALNHFFFFFFFWTETFFCPQCSSPFFGWYEIIRLSSRLFL